MRCHSVVWHELLGMRRGSSLKCNTHQFRVHVAALLPKGGAAWRVDEELAHLRDGGFEDVLVNESMLMLVDNVLDVVELPFHEQAKGICLLLIEFIRPVVALVPDLRISRMIDGCEAVLKSGGGFLEPTEPNLLGVLSDL